MSSRSAFLFVVAVTIPSCVQADDTAAQTTKDQRPGGMSDSARVRLSHVVLSEGGPLTTVLLDSGRVVAVGPAARSGRATTIDMGGQALIPAFIDSHVHLSYLPADPTQGGVAAAVDLAAPVESLDSDPAPLTLLSSGPMITALGGYPTTSWGQAGYGLECADGAAAVAAVDSLLDRGAAVIKLPITGSAVLSESDLRQAADRAHERGVRVVSHAMDNEAVIQAQAIGVDALAHTPTAPLSDAALQAWSTGAVITTLAAFGSSQSARENLAALRALGTTILYGTDHGNLQTAGISASELSAMLVAGMDGSAIIAAATTAPAAYWGFDALGSIEAGKSASFLVIDGDPWTDPLLLASPAQIWMDGVAIN